MAVEKEPLAVYLHEHLAGAHGAEDLAQQLSEHCEDAELGAFLKRFVTEIREDRSHVERALQSLQEGRSLVRRGLDVAAAVAGKAGRIASAASPGLFADLEALALGVWGKRLLWGTLQTLSEIEPRFADLPLTELIDRAERHEKELLRFRQATIIPSLASGSS